jgi:hypothetical protein
MLEMVIVNVTVFSRISSWERACSKLSLMSSQVISVPSMV